VKLDYAQSRVRLDCRPMQPDRHDGDKHDAPREGGDDAGLLAAHAAGDPHAFARLYDRFWRPTFVRLLAGKGAGAAVGGLSGELFIHKLGLGLEDRPGPWLDLSCGPGAFARALAAAAPGALVVGLDLSRAMLDVAAQRTAGYSNVVLVRADAHAMPFVDGAFAGVNNAGALHAYDDPELVFREIRRVLRPGGHYVGSTFAEAPSLLGRLTARAAGIRRFEPSELRTWLQRIGFADYEDVRLGGALVFRVRRP